MRHPGGPPSGGPKGPRGLLGQTSPGGGSISPGQGWHFGAGGGCGDSARVAHATPRRRGSCTRSMTWGSASADRSIIESNVSSLTCRQPRSSERGKRQTRAASATRAPQLEGGFGQVPGAGSDGNGKRATAAVMRYGCRRGKSSEGVNRVAGNDPGDLCPLPLGADGMGLRPSGNAANPRSVAGCNKPAPSRAE